MKSGSLRYRIQIQAATEGADAMGGVTETWSTAATVWGSVRDLSGRELMQGEGTEAHTSVEVIMRWNSTVTAKHRLRVQRPDTTVWRTFAIQSPVIVDDRRRTISCLCTENTRA